jgi:hypothetical protein
MSTHELVDPNDAAFRLMSELLDVNFKTLNVTFETARDIVHSALRDGQCHVCGRRVGEGVHIITQEIRAAMNDKTWFLPPPFLPHEFVDIKISLRDLLEYSRKLGYERARAAKPDADCEHRATDLVKGLLEANRNMSREDARQACAEKFPELGKNAFERRVWKSARKALDLGRAMSPGRPKL